MNVLFVSLEIISAILLLAFVVSVVKMLKKDGHPKLGNLVIAASLIAISALLAAISNFGYDMIFGVLADVFMLLGAITLAMLPTKFFQAPDGHGLFGGGGLSHHD